MEKSFSSLDLHDSVSSSDEDLGVDVPFLEDTDEAAGAVTPPVRSDDEENEDGGSSSSSSVDPRSAYKTNYEIDPKDLKLDNLIGSGAYGKVYRGKLHGKDVAIKKLTTKFLDEKALSNFLKEVDILCSLRHPNVILFMGACTTPGNLTIITELMPRGSVSDLLKSKDVNLTFKNKMKLAKDAALGMNALHNKKPPILHLDLKSANILVDENWEGKVADFGLSKINLTGTNRGLLGSPVYMSPEMLLNLEYDEKTDIYSFGMVLYEMLSGEEPFKGQFSDMTELINGVVKQNQRPELPPCPRRLAKLIQSCWDTVPSKRPSFEDMLTSKVFDKVIVEALLTDKRGAALWQKNFLGQDAAPWAKFQKAYYKYFNLSPKIVDTKGETKIQCLKILIADNETETVTIENFARALECFGPMENLAWLDKLGEILSKPWFYGDINTKEAEVLLAAKKPGSYIVRFSSDPGSFTISCKNKQSELAHYRIKHKAGLKFLLGNAEFDSLEAVIKHHRKKLYLRKAVGGSKYEFLFSKGPLRDVISAYESQQ
ncbi:protein kinase [Balamuthia mandrillaris]